MDFSTCFVVHHTCPLGCPVVVTGEHREQRTGHQHIVEMSHHVVTVLQLQIDGGHRQNKSSETTHSEHKDETDCKKHRGFKRHGTAPHGGNPVKDLDTGRYRNQHGCVHEKQLSGHRHAGCVHVVRPYDERQNGDR